MFKVINKLCFITILVLNLAVITAVHAEESKFVEKKTFEAEIKKVNDAILSIKKSNKDLKDNIIEQQKKNEDLQKLIGAKEEGINKNIDAVKEDTGKQILSIIKTINTRSNLWIIAIVGIIFFCIFTYLLLRKNLASNKRTLEEQIIKTLDGMEMESLKLDSKLMEILETQLKIFKENTRASQNQETELDHSLALRVGEEIHRMRKRISNMASDVKGIGALTNSLTRLEEEFNSNGYEIVDLLGNRWNEGLNVSARFIPSDDLKPGEEIITKVIKPQINYKNRLIKAAEIEVSTGG